ncbi:MAG TPA: hypothetical protein VNM37_09400 [Candidatus Dormibacteraeota bacterium]|nr:hypothetical protein [Candidatus Dormibacteraeota bacterium]
MPRTSKKQQLAAKQDPAAPFLFDEQELPIRNDLVQAIKERAYEHTGARLLDNHEEVLRLVELLMMGWGLKKISKALGHSKHSVRAARDVLVAQGRLAPFKERIVRNFEDIIETGSAAYLEALENGTVPAAQIPVGVGIFSDKRALALGEPTAIAGQVAAAGQAEDLSVEKLNAWFEGLKRAAVDVPSSVTKEDSQ